MANAVFSKYRRALMTGGANLPDLLTHDIKAVLVDGAEIVPDPSASGHEFLSDIEAGVIATSENLSNKSVVGTTFDADDTPLTDAGTEEGEYIVLYRHTGTASTSRLIAMWDTATGLPLTLNGVDDLIRWHPSGIFTL